MRILRGVQPAGVGCHEDKMLLADILIETLRLMRERATELRLQPDELRRVLDEGREAARAVAAETMARVRAGMGLWQTSIPVPTA